jgi:putative holliday junction resolvase
MAAPAPRSVLSLDVGRKRIGLAGCDPLGLTVKPLPALHRGRYPADLQQLQALVQERRILALVVGLHWMPSSNPLPKRSTAAATANAWPGTWPSPWPL